ncbi:Ken-052 [Symbiodinium sp. CCMP2592]|nr:Ken-052 [Symbiodinium sp. CCMP2592]
MEMQWVVQLLTVTLTLLVVVVVRDFQAWLTAPRTAASNSAEPSTGETVTAPTEETPGSAAPSVPTQGDGTKGDLTPTVAAVTPSPDGDGASQQVANDGDGSSQNDGKQAPDSGKGITQAPPSPKKVVQATKDDADAPVVTPEAMMQELQACHTTVKNFAANMSRLLNGITRVAPNLAKVQTELESNQKATHALEVAVEKALGGADLKDLPKEIKEMNKRASALESIVGAVTAKMGTMSQNVDSFGKSNESQLKDVLKGVAAVASSSKQQNLDLTTHVTTKTSMLESGVKEVLRKITATDYDSHTSMTATVKDVSNQVYDLGQELLAAHNFLQGEVATQKENVFQLATVLASISEQVRVIRDYCERPVPVAVSGQHDRPPMPPPSYEPNLQHGPRQLNLNTALPVARSPSAPEVRIQMGDGRCVNIPMS